MITRFQQRHLKVSVKYYLQVAFIAFLRNSKHFINVTLIFNLQFNSLCYSW